MIRSLFIAGTATAAASFFIVSCGGAEPTSSSASGTGGTGGGGTTTTSTTSSSASSTSSTSSSSSTGGTGGGGLCGNAPVLDLGVGIDGELTRTGQEDYYRISGKKGQPLMLDIDAQFLGMASYDPTYIDAVITLFDASGVQIAQNNEPVEFTSNDSRLYTILPADGDYCVRVAECWSVIADPGNSCAAPKDKAHTLYSLYAEQILDDPGEPGTADLELGDDASTATALDYVKSSGKYVTTTIWGSFKSEDDVDVFSFTPPTDISGMPTGVRPVVNMYIMQSGPGQSGSTAPTGVVSVVDPATPGTSLGEVNAVNSVHLSPRVELGHAYDLFVRRPKGMMGANDFYVLRYFVRWGNPLEAEKGSGANDTAATAEVLPSNKDIYIEGDLVSAPQDIDNFLTDVPAGMTTVSVSCIAQVRGSGLRGMTLSLLASDGSPLANNASDTETNTHFPGVANIPLGGAAQVVLEMKASSQAPSVTNAFYVCGIHFKP